MTFEIGWVLAEVQILKKKKWDYCKMTFTIGRGFAERQILKSENGLISWTEWNILIDFCVIIDYQDLAQEIVKCHFSSV